MKVKVNCQYKIEELDHLISVNIRKDNGDHRIAFAMAEQTFDFTDEQREKVVHFLEQIAKEVSDE